MASKLLEEYWSAESMCPEYRQANLVVVDEHYEAPAHNVRHSVSLAVNLRGMMARHKALFN